MSDEEPKKSQPRSSNALVFVSHDTRDADIAEAFSKLLSSVSAGVLKSFRSSDKKGNQGIEYGVDWYPTIMDKLKDASDVVCLLTPHSIGRPWILYEAGVAKGQLDTPVHGLVLGLALAEAGTGPFAQFQNCDDSEDAVTSLVMQLVSRIPNAEPDREVVVSQVKSFITRVHELLAAQGHKEERPKKLDNSSVAKLFEEIKVMYLDLPGRIENRLDNTPKRRRKHRRMHPEMLHESLHEAMHCDDLRYSPLLPMLAVLSQYKEELPWVYDILQEACIAETLGNNDKAIKLIRALETSIESHTIRRMVDENGSKDTYVLLREMRGTLHMARAMLSDRSESMGKSISEAAKRKQDFEFNPDLDSSQVPDN